MNILSPSILSANFCELGKEVETVSNAGAKYIHIDVMDGMFVPSISYGMPVIKSIRSVTDAVFDVHLMINEPIRYIKEFVESGADLITVHVEACEDIQATLDKIHSFGIKAALALNPETPIEKVIPYVESVDMILVMSVHPGFAGQKFIPGVLDKAKMIRHYCKENGIDLDMEIDGGIKLDNVSLAIEAGINIIVAGSSVFKDDREENVKAFLKKING